MYNQTEESIALIIRPYRPSDIAAVHTLFANGIGSLAPTAWSTVVQSREVGFPLLLSSVFIATMSRKSKPSVMVVSLTLGTTLPLLVLYCWIHHQNNNYIKSSIKGDLSDIEGVYGKGRGCFLVAEECYSGKIVGTVAGEDHGNGVFELRRMSVDAQTRKRGVGRQLLLALERELEPKTKIFLTTTSLQYAAHALYERNGFIRTHIVPLNHFVAIWHYEKTYIVTFDTAVQ